MQKLPRPLSTIEIPSSFSPSTLGAWGGCAAKVATGSVVRNAGVAALAGGPNAAVGTLIHRALERWARNREATNPGEVFDIEYVRLSEELARDPVRQHFADLAQTKGLAEWNRLRAWVIERCNAVPKKRGGPHDNDFANQNKTAWVTGAEVPLMSPRLRLQGRADRVRRLGANAFEIRDYKSGSVVMDDGSVKEEVALQLQAYGLMLLERHPGASIRLVVDDGADREVEFDDMAQRSAEQRIQEIVALLPPAGEVSMEKAAAPGPGCFGCRIRHVCSPYHRKAQEWWLEHPVEVERIPNDTWGTVVDVGPGVDSVGVVLVDVAGRRVKVDRLDGRHGFPDQLRSRRIWLFELESSGPSRGFNGARYHPRVFHELARDRRERRAWIAQLFH